MRIIEISALGALCGVLVLAAALTACRSSSSAANRTPDLSPPTLRLYVVSDLAGALEPCGCAEGQLGGLAHAAAFIKAEHARAPFSMLVASGSLFFSDPWLEPDHGDQDLSKAQTIAASLAPLGLTAFAAGANDWAAGEAALRKLSDESGPLLAANLSGQARGGAAGGWRATALHEIDGIKVGLVGASADPPGAARRSLDVTDAVRKSVAELRGRGADVVIALAALGRAEAERIAEGVPGLTAIVVGSSSSTGDANVDAPPAERIGGAILVQTANHLQTVGVLDLYVRDRSFTFTDASGTPAAREPEPGAAVAPPAQRGSFYRYKVQEIEPSVGTDPAIAEGVLRYFKKVNERNKHLLEGRFPPVAAADQATYVGVEECTICHDSSRTVWDKTAHAHAYATLSRQDKQYNLDCVGCHVTGYGQPGGSTVAHVERGENVQCEVCHGPGSLHAKAPRSVKPLVPKPGPDLCLSCHQPPYGREFDPKAKMEAIRGPGHGKPG